MIDVVRTPLRDLPGAVTDIDVAADGTWVAACESDAGPMICTANARIASPTRDSPPIVRLLQNRDILVVLPRARVGDENAAIVSPTGVMHRRFAVGDGVQDVLVLGDRIVCSYFDEGTLYGGPGAEGICVFGERGDLMMGYHSDIAGAVLITDCYCIAPTGVDEVCFSASVEFRLVVLNVRTGVQRVHALPERLAGSSAVSSAGDTFYLHDPYSERTMLFSWRPGENPVSVGSHEQKLRGAPAGMFVAATQDGYVSVRARSP